jgi:outer membrane protein assembly factor BamB
LLYAGCADHYVYAIDIATGAITWKFKGKDVIYKNPLVINNNIFTGGLNDNLYLLNGSNGAVIWVADNDENMSSPTLDNGIIYSGGGASACGYDIATGSLQWFFRVLILGGRISNDRSSAAILNGTLYGGSNDGKFYANDINSKTQIWSIATSAYEVYSSPVVVNGILYIGGGQDVYAVDAVSGSIKWKTGTKGQVSGSACVVDQKGIKHYPGISGEQN